MNLGMLKLFSLIITIVLLNSGCYDKKEHNKSIKQEIKSQPKENNTTQNKIELTNKKDEFALKLEQNTTNKKDVNLSIKSTIKKEKKVITPKKSTQLNKNNLDDFAFDLIKKGVDDNNTLLIVGGIQGDEPGGFMAASLIATHYTITKGSVWIIPNLNFYSIIKRSRGPFGDMNRKFANLPKSDPEYKIIQRIKSCIINPSVKLIVNLHDGSGFYRPMYIDKMHQPLRWGQSLVIDQEILPNVEKYADTYTISEQVVKHINKHLLKQEDMYRTKNTHTRFKKTYEEQEMAKTLTYFAVTHGKAAFGHETSKSLNVNQRIYYKLLALEKYMDIMGIKYKRKFELNLKGINKVVNDDISIKFNDINIAMPLKDIRNVQRFFPIDKNGIVKYLPSNPLIKIIKQKNTYLIYYGNRKLTQLQADYADIVNFNIKIPIIIDGKKKMVKFGDTIEVKHSFKVLKNDFRVNVIGYKNKSGIETDITIKKNMFLKRYSIEKKASIYRIEFYHQKIKFAGMILVKYIQ